METGQKKKEKEKKFNKSIKILIMPKDACYYKVKRQYKVFPSAYASGAIAKCRKNKSKKKK